MLKKLGRSPKAKWNNFQNNADPGTLNFAKTNGDVIGDAYEYLISNYASNAGKSGGEFFTPQTVSKLLEKLIMDGKTSINKVYDPTCGERVIIVMGAVCVNKSTVSGTLTKYISYIA